MRALCRHRRGGAPHPASSAIAQDRRDPCRIYPYVPRGNPIPSWSGDVRRDRLHGSHAGQRRGYGNRCRRRLLSPPTAPGGARIGPGAVPRRAAGDGIAASRDLPVGRPRQLGRMGQGSHRLRRQGQQLDARLRREAGWHRAVQARHGPDAEVPGPGSGQGVRTRRRRRPGDHVHRPRPDAGLLQVGEHRGAAWLDATFPRWSVHAGSGGDDGSPTLGPDQCPRHEEHRAAARRAAHARRGTLPDTRAVRRAHDRTPTRAPLQQQQRGDGRRAEDVRSRALRSPTPSTRPPRFPRGWCRGSASSTTASCSPRWDRSVKRSCAGA